MKRKLSLLLSVLMIISMMTACSSTTNTDTPGNTTGEEKGEDKSQEQTSEKKAKDTITLIVQSEPATLDPAYANNDNITIVLQFIYEDLFTLGADGVVVPELAESYEQVDETTVKFKLKEGVKFSDGTDLKSSDVLWAIKRC